LIETGTDGRRFEEKEGPSVKREEDELRGMSFEREKAETEDSRQARGQQMDHRDTYPNWVTISA